MNMARRESSRTRLLRRLAGGAAALTLSAGATAQSAPEAEAQAAHAAKARAATMAPAPAQPESVFEVVTEEGAFQVRMTGDSIDAFLDGKPLAPERLRISPNSIQLLDGKLHPIATMIRPAARLGALAQARGSATFSMSGGIRVSSPRVIGVVTNPVDGALAAQLGLEPQKALVISAVMPGRPAEAAGVKPFDVITAIDGQQPATIETLRAALSNKQAGQPVELSIVRHGDPIQISVNFTEVDEAHVLERLDNNVLVPAGDAIYAWRTSEANVAPEVEREMREWVRQRWRTAPEQAASPELRLYENLKLDEERRRQLERSMKLASESLRELNIGSALPEVSFVGPEGRDVALFPRGTARAVAAAAASERELAVRLREVEARLQRLERLLQRLVELDEQSGLDSKESETKTAPSEQTKTGT